MNKYLNGKLAIFFFMNAAILNGQSCGCSENLEFVMGKMKKNYIGYTDKLKKTDPMMVTKLTDSLISLSVNLKNEMECFNIIHQWLSIFNDGHVGVSLNADSINKDSLHNFFSNSEKIAISVDSFFSYLRTQKKYLDTLEGVWQHESASLQVGIMRDHYDKNEFVGFVIKTNSNFWDTGQIRFRIVKKNGYCIKYFYSRDHLKVKTALNVADSILDMGVVGYWQKVNNFTGSVQSINLKTIFPTFRIIDNKNCLITIPSFHTKYKQSLDSLLFVNDSIIKSTNNFIIDLRGNTGGSVLTFENLMPPIYTNPIIIDGADVLATEDNIRNNYEITDYEGINDSMKTVFKKEAAILWKNVGKVYRLWKNDTLTLDRVWDYPQKVSIIIDNNCGSATEMFLVGAMQSKKVTLFGQHTAGAVDYSDPATLQMPCTYFKLHYSTSRTNRLPDISIDNIGIMPDVKIDSEKKDWVSFIINYYINKK